MDEKVAGFLGTVWCKIAHIVIIAAYMVLGGDAEQLTLWLSIEAILLTLFVQGAVNEQGERMEEALHEDVERTREVHQVTVVENPDTPLGE